MPVTTTECVPLPTKIRRYRPAVAVPDGMEDWKQGHISLGYDRQFGRHAVDAAVNLHISAYNGDGIFSYQYHYLNYNGRVNYSYDDRYVAEFGFSYFGNDAFCSRQPLVVLSFDLRSVGSLQLSLSSGIRK